MDEQDLPQPKPTFKKKKSASHLKHTNQRISRPPSPPASPINQDISLQKIDHDELQNQGNTVISRLAKKSNQSLRHNITPSKPAQPRKSFGTAGDDSFDSNQSVSNPVRRKLARPESFSALDNLAGDQSTPINSPASRSVSHSSRPTYSSAHLNELKSLTLSSSTARLPEDAFDGLTRSKFSGYDDQDDFEASFGAGDAPIASIPTSAAISSAKERRSQARKGFVARTVQAGGSPEIAAADDFISLSTKPSAFATLGANKKGESRLVREEDEFGEGDDEHADFTGAKERVPLGEAAGMKAEASKKAGMEAMILDTEADFFEGNEEEMEWEAAQIRRGGIGGSAEKTTTEPVSQVYKAAPIPEYTTLASFSSVETRLLSSLQTVEASIAEHAEAAVHFATDEKTLSEQESELRLEVSRQASREEFFHELNAFIKDMDSFFAEKWPQLEKIEQDLLSISKERAQLIFDRRYQDLSDDLVLFKRGEVGVKRPGGSEEAEHTLDQNGEADQAQGSDDVDELGRSRRELDTSSHALSRRSRREDRLERRKRRRMRAPACLEQDDEGFSTDDSLSPADSADLLSASKGLISSAQAVLLDTNNPVFLSPTNEGSILDRFLSWKAKYPEEYANAFGNLALVQAWEFWARLELVAGLNIWGLREWVGTEERRGIENWKWMRGLEVYEDRVEEAGSGEGSQESVIAAMVSTVVIPSLVPIIRCSYDPFSAGATARSLELVEQVGYVLETADNPTYDEFVMSFLSRFTSAVFELGELVGSQSTLAEALESQVGMAGIEARRRFLCKSLKLLKQGMRWKRVGERYLLEHARLERASLKSLLVDQLVEKVMVPILLISWETGGKEVAQQVLEICPTGYLSKPIYDLLQSGHT